MLDSIRDLIERTRTDPDFKRRVKARTERERDRVRPLWRKHADRWEKRAATKQQTKAKLAVQQALGDGRLKRGNCADKWILDPCSGYIRAYHVDGYGDAHLLNVTWLCQKHRKKRGFKRQGI